MQTLWKVTSGDSVSFEASKLSPVTQKILFNRGIRTTEEAERFLKPSFDHLQDPFLFEEMKQAVQLILQNRTSKKKVLLHGDYDADGITSCAILSFIMERLEIPYRAFLPHRFEDGYGVSAQAIHQAAEEGADLLITADCGSNAKEQIALAKRLGMRVIVIDHHTIQEQTKAEPDVLINPELETCHYPYKGFASCGLSFKLGQALLGLEVMKNVIDIAAVGTVSDLAPLTGENRVIVKLGLEKLSRNPTCGLKALSTASRLKARKLNASHLGFVFGPRINASGRMGTAEVAYRLLVTKNEKEAVSLAHALDEENRFRQRTEAKMVQEAVKKAKEECQNDFAIVVWQKDWHAGVVGIVAARLVDRFYKPALVLALDEVTGLAKGSGRSISSVNLVSTLEAMSSHLTTFGGHEQAVGLSLKQETLETFRQNINMHLKSLINEETFLKPLRVDAEIQLSDLTPQLISELDQLEPYGFSNPKPVFLIKNLKLKSQPKLKNPDIASAWVTDGRLVYEASLDKLSKKIETLKNTDPFDAVLSLKSRSFFGEDRVALEIKDLKIV